MKGRTPVDILVTGITGVVGTEVWHRLLQVPHDHRITGVSRQGMRGPAHVLWDIGRQPAPAALRRHWDVIIHTAASTRWTMTAPEATAANIEPTRAIMQLADDRTHLVHVSTAFVERDDMHEAADGEVFDGYRNGYEWSKALCERMIQERSPGPATIVRPPLILGRSADGVISRFSGPYTIAQALVSGLAAAVVGEPEGYAEIAPVDQVAQIIVDIAVGPPPPNIRTGVVAGGRQSLRLGQLIHIMTQTLNEWRSGRELEPLVEPPTVSADAWHRFYLPLAREYLSPIQHQAVTLLGMFEAYTSLTSPFKPDWVVSDPASTLARSIRYWAQERPRLASRTPEPWARIAAPLDA
jgi:nucleoside-diphosphate-sugar epimerase